MIVGGLASSAVFAATARRPRGSSAPKPSATRRSSVLNSSLRMKPVSASASGSRTTRRVERNVERHVAVERDQRPRQPRLVGEGDQALAPLRLLDLGRAREQRVEVAIFADQQRRGLDPDARHARHVVGGVADQRLHLDHLGGRHAEALDHLGLADHLVLHGVVHAMPGRTSCIRSLSEDTMVTSAPAASAWHGIGGDDVVGLVAFLLDAGDVEGLHRVADQRELRDEVLGHVGPVRLVAVEQIVAEGLRRIVEDHREMGGRARARRSRATASTTCRRSRARRRRAARRTGRVSGGSA